MNHDGGFFIADRDVSIGFMKCKNLCTLLAVRVSFRKTKKFSGS